MPALQTASDVATIDQLRADEAALDRRLDEARRAAEREVAAARQRAGQESAEGAQRLVLELRQREEELRRRCAEVEASARAEAVRSAEAVRTRAEARRADAVALLISALEGLPP